MFRRWANSNVALSTENENDRASSSKMEDGADTKKAACDGSVRLPVWHRVWRLPDPLPVARVTKRNIAHTKRSRAHLFLLNGGLRFLFICSTQKGDCLMIKESHASLRAKCAEVVQKQ
jgi:hypothetical protein